LNKWSRPGFSLTKDSTVIGKKTPPDPLAITLKAYPGNLRRDIMLTELNSTQGSYPRIMIASGKDMPSEVPDGKVVHIRYTELLNGDGTPRAAKEIWKILASAGIPRYAELICFSGDPGEAAVNYFILKLMGFPDVKVLVK
jgi:hypothetical protein